MPFGTSPHRHVGPGYDGKLSWWKRPLGCPYPEHDIKLLIIFV